ncbi:MAG: Rho termination factor N-terminal domain-containing protein, partial [Bdellovibrionaceae bacterium]|nr:Rho termination factor N-terminal domain-containing protein [Pseudobdellovibrionaceae bacterium]
MSKDSSSEVPETPKRRPRKVVDFNLGHGPTDSATSLKMANDVNPNSVNSVIQGPVTEGSNEGHHGLDQRDQTNTRAEEGVLLGEESQISGEPQIKSAEGSSILSSGNESSVETVSVGTSLADDSTQKKEGEQKKNEDQVATVGGAHTEKADGVTQQGANGSSSQVGDLSTKSGTSSSSGASQNQGYDRRDRDRHRDRFNKRDYRQNHKGDGAQGNENVQETYDLTDVNLTEAEKSWLSSKDLKKRNISELTELATKLKIENAAGLRRQDLVFEILKRAAQIVDIHGSGVLEILPEGYGFLRSPDYNY